jgi:hypothetical protein
VSRGIGIYADALTGAHSNATDCRSHAASISPPNSHQPTTRSGRLLGGSVQAHPTRPGCFFYAAASGIVCVYDVRWRFLLLRL